ncbi:MAG: PAS domain S-box protein [Nitrospira sp.]|nr:PAS domain S-box protein [Nitrospira sp.]
MVMDDVSIVWILAAVNVSLVVPLILLLIHSSRRAQAGWLRAEEERIRFQENEHRLRSILEAEPQGILVLGLDCRVLQINPAGRVLFDAGFSEEIIGKDFRDHIHPSDRSKIEEMQGMARNGRESCAKGRLVGLSGYVRWVDITSVPLPAEDGRVQAVLSVIRDVTEQKRADRRQALQHAVAKVLASASAMEQAVPDLLQAIVMSLEWHVGVFWRVQDDRQTITRELDWSVDPTAVPEFLRVSRQQAYTLGCDLPGRCWARGEPLWVEDVGEEPVFTRGSAGTVRTLRAACAFPIWLRANVYGVMEFFSEEAHPEDRDLLKALATAGNQIGLFVERTEVEAALHEHEARTRLIIDTALDAVITTDQTGSITEWNTQAEQMFGWSAREAMGRDLAETIISPSNCAHYREYVRHLLGPGDAFIPSVLVELTGLRCDGWEFPVEIAMRPLSIEGSLIFSAFIRDITSRKEAERALQGYAQQLESINRQLDTALTEAKAATEAKSSFLATMSHEIRTPMNGVIGMTNILLETHLTDEQRECAETVRACGDHLLTILNDILDFSKIEAGKLDLEVIEFDLRVAIDESLDLVAERASSKSLNVTCLFHADVPRDLLGDPGRVRQIVMNLISNAIKFTDSGDVIVEVTVESQSSEEAIIRVAVTDTGVGIPEEARERLFQSFSQADGSTTRKYGGTGLGLAICKRLVEMMGGTMGVMSRVGQGSCFWFTVNFRKQVAGAQDIDPSTVVLAGLRVLIVDEKAINRRSLEQMAKTWDMRPTCVRSGSEALDLLSRESEDLPFDLVLLDMGSTDGVELVQAIKGRAGGARPGLVLLTSLGRRGDAKMAKEAGVAACLTKPIRDRQLLDCLVAVMTQARTRLQVSPQHGALPLITRHSLAETEAKVDLRILLAEDNIVNQKVAVRLFQRLGYRIDVVANGREVVEALSRIRYDVVFMDCQMPDMDGFEATHVIRGSERSDRVPIIAMTANAMQGDRERCLAAGMDDYISKPISVDALARALDRVSQERGRIRSKKSQEAA